MATSLASQPVLQAPDSRKGRAVGEDGRFAASVCVGGGGLAVTRTSLPLICLKCLVGDKSEHSPGEITGCWKLSGSIF